MDSFSSLHGWGAVEEFFFSSEETKQTRERQPECLSQTLEPLLWRWHEILKRMCGNDLITYRDKCNLGRRRSPCRCTWLQRWRCLCYLERRWPLRPGRHSDDVNPPRLFFFFSDVSCASSRASASAPWETISEGGGGGGAEGRITDSIPHLLLLHLAGFMRLILDNLVVTRHCTQPPLIFNEGSGPSAAAFWAFNGRVFQWRFCAVTFQAFPKIASDEKAFTVLRSPASVMLCMHLEIRAGNRHFFFFHLEINRVITA